MRITRLIMLVAGLAVNSLFAAETHSPSQPELQTLSQKEWLRLIAYHKAQLSVRRADVCFLGDSLTEFWAHHGKQAWQEKFRGWQMVNCGIAADCTEHILYRLYQLGLDKAKPRAVVLLMGTNNLSKDTPDSPVEVAKACETAIEYIHRASPETHILLLTIPPNTFEANSPLHRSIRATNELLVKLGAGHDATVLDIYPLFVNSSDAWLPGLTLDGTHFSEDGYEVLAQAIRPKLIEMIGAPQK